MKLSKLNDASERKRAEQALAEKARLLDLSHDAIVISDFSGKVTLWNKGAEKLYGWTSAEAVGEKLDALLKIEFPRPTEEIVAELERDGRFEGEVIQVARNGDRVRALCRRVLDPGTTSVLTSYTDITDRKEIEEELGRAHALLGRRARQLELLVAERTEELIAANNQLEAFVYTIAHDLRAPLRSMKGFSSILMEDESHALSPKGQDYALRIHKSARFMDAMLNDLLAFSRLSHEKLDLAPVNLQPIVQETSSGVESDLLDNKGRVEAHGPWPSVLAHGPTLSQVFYNLVSNALKFARPGVPPLIRIWAEEVNLPLKQKPGSRAQGGETKTNTREPAPAVTELPPPNKITPGNRADLPTAPYVRIWVEDNGIGIEPEYREQIFRVFIRLESNAYQGTGIGLAIVQKGIERMGGQVGVESTLGKGSRFWFELRKA
jgi:PAS domain S-box-containing protein